MKIVLIGFMGTGKTTVAPILAKKLGLNVIEMDDLITDKAGKSIKQIFAESGEAGFRELEVAVGKDLQNIDSVVISTGGGVVMNEIILDNLKNNSIIIDLSATFNNVLKRISPKIPRPLFEDKDKAQELYELRKPLYKKFANIQVSTDGKTVNEVVDDIIARINL